MGITSQRLDDICLSIVGKSDYVMANTHGGVHLGRIMYGAGIPEAEDLVNAYNSGRYRDARDVLLANDRYVTGHGDDLCRMLRGVMNQPQPAAVNPTFQNNASPNGGKPVPKGYQGGHLDPTYTQATVLKRANKKPCQMWKVRVSHPNIGGGKTLLWTDHERLADDLVIEINNRNFQATWDFMDWIKHNIPQVGFGQAGTHLKADYDMFMDILEHEISNAKGRKASASMFTIQYDDEPEEADDTNYALDAGDTFGIGQPDRKSTKQWEPDVPDPSVDLMKSIHDACHR